MIKSHRFLGFSLLLGGALRAFGLGRESLWLDEASTARRAGLTNADLFLDAGSGSQVPLYFWVSKAWSSLAGTGEASLRFPALFFGILIIPMVFLLGRELFGEKAGRWGAFLSAINPVLIHYSQDARPYSLFALLVVSSWYFLIRWVRSGETGPFFGWCSLTVGVLYTHPLGALVLPSHLAGFVLFPRMSGMHGAQPRTRAFLGGMILVALPYLPLLFRMADQIGLKLVGESVANWIDTPSLYDLFFTPVWYFTRRLLAGLVALLLILGMAVRPRPSSEERWAILFLGAVWGSFSLLPWVASFLVTPMYVFRYTIPVLPPLLILLGWTVARLAPSVRAIAVILILAASTGLLYDYHTGLDKPPWREAGRWLTERSRPGDLVIWDPGFLEPLSDYYFPPQEGVEVLFLYSVESAVSSVHGVQRVWVVTQDKSDYGISRAFLDGLVPGWSVLEERFLNESYPLNPRAISLPEVVVRGFEPSQGVGLMDRG